MTPGARLYARENPGRAETAEELMKQAAGPAVEMQQSRAGSLITGNPLCPAGGA